MRFAPFTAFAAACVLSPAWSQATWTPLSPVTAPPARAGATGASLGNAFLLFGGNLNNVMRNDVWSFDGLNWVDLTPIAGAMPVGRDWHGCCWDEANQRLVVFGGRNTANTDLGDTWTFDGSSWTQHTTPVAPSPRRWAAMQYDPIRGNVILFGGHDNVTRQFFNDTWSWNGSSWTLLAPATAPTARARGHMAWYPPTQELMYWGGRTALSGGVTGETWLFNGTTWRQSATATIPGPTSQGLIAAAMTYDAYRERMVLFGGTFSGPTLGTTWEFDGADWRSKGNPGNVSGRTFPSMGYLSSTRALYIFGGFGTVAMSDTWKYETSTPASVSISGSGCTGSAGVPSMGSIGLPWTGDSFSISVANVGAAPTFLAIGSSNSIWNGLPLPLSLAFLNAAGCTLYTGVDTTIGLAPVGGIATFTAAVPADPTLKASTVYLQGLVFDPAANGLGFTFSDLASATIGSR